MAELKNKLNNKDKKLHQIMTFIEDNFFKTIPNSEIILNIQINFSLNETFMKNKDKMH